MYVGVLDLVQTRAACSDGFSDHCIFVSPYYYYLRGRFLCRTFFDACLPHGVGVQNVKGVEAKIRRFERIRNNIFMVFYVK